MTREYPFSGVQCTGKEQKCKVWWAGTDKQETTTIQVTIPFRDASILVGQERVRAEQIVTNKLEDLFRNSTAIIP